MGYDSLYLSHNNINMVCFSSNGCEICIYFPPFYNLNNLDHLLFTYCLIYIVSKYIFASVSMAYNVEENHQIATTLINHHQLQNATQI